MKKTITLFSFLLICFASFGQTLTLSFAHQQAECDSTRSYFVFDIIAASNPATIFDSCIIDIYCNSAAFGNWITNNNAVLCTPAASNYAAVVNNLNSSEIRIILRYTGNSAPNGLHLIPGGTDVLVTVKIPIKNCETSTLSFMPFQSLGQASSFYAEATTPTIGDSLYISSYSCGTDSLPDLICYDTTHIPVTIYNFLKTAYNNNNFATPDMNSTACTSQITGFTPRVYPGTYYAGTNTDEWKMKITGYGFGSSRGSVSFPNADDPGGNNINLNDYDFISWSDSLIEIRMPSVIDSFPIGADPSDYTFPTPGGGPFQVNTSCGFSLQPSDANGVDMPYAIKNFIMNAVNNIPYKKIRFDLANHNNAGGYTFLLDTSITHYPDPKLIPAIKKAAADWVCATRVNFIIGGADSASAGATRIYFSNALDSATGMKTNYLSTAYCSNGINTSLVPAGFEIVINGNQSCPWFIDTTGAALPPGMNDFYASIQHEFGHAGLLAHVSNSDDLMFYNIPPGTLQADARKQITNADQTGGISAVNVSSANTAYCSAQGPLILAIPPINCSFNDGIQKLNPDMLNINVYPNPVDDNQLTIAYEIKQNSKVIFSVADIAGRLIYSISENQAIGIHEKKLSLENTAPGIYILRADIGNAFQSFKIVKVR